MFKNENQQFLTRKLFESSSKLTKVEIQVALDRVVQQVDLNIDYFQNNFPTPQTFNNTYYKMENTEWTNGFWTGVLWLCYEYTKNEKYLKILNSHVDSFHHRIVHKIEVNHHDMGFLYIPSCVAAYKLKNNLVGKDAALLAADNLLSRYQPEAQFIQAWNPINGNQNCRLIIDTLLNIPLLYWASEQTNNPQYASVGINHFNTSLATVIRPDGTTYHTYYFDEKIKLPLYGKTRQGYSDQSCWARGQAWGIYGIALTWKYFKNDVRLNQQTMAIFEKVTKQFLNNLGTDDQVAYWDLIFNDDPTQPRDSSASAIAVCGLLEMLKHLSLTDPNYIVYEQAAHCILRSLIRKYAVCELKRGNCLLYHGVYSWHTKKGVNEGNIWGDYFYCEALLRLWTNWKTYW